MKPVPQYFAFSSTYARQLQCSDDDLPRRHPLLVNYPLTTPAASVSIVPDPRAAAKILIHKPGGEASSWCEDLWTTVLTLHAFLQESPA